MSKKGISMVWLACLGIILLPYLFLYCAQRSILFRAHEGEAQLGKVTVPSDYGLQDFKELYLTTQDDLRILAWFHPPKKGYPVILYFHGNTTHLGGHAHRYKAFSEAGYGVFALSWRGYGKSQGTPTEAGLYEDGRAALAWLNHTFPPNKIILYGESLGSGVAIEMAKEQPVLGVVLQGAYTSIGEVAEYRYPFVPGVRYLVQDQFNSLAKISHVTSPILIIHGAQDETVPVSEAKQLAAAAMSRKELFIVPNLGHVDIPDRLIIRSIQDFFGHSPA